MGDERESGLHVRRGQSLHLESNSPSGGGRRWRLINDFTRCGPELRLSCNSVTALGLLTKALYGKPCHQCR